MHRTPVLLGLHYSFRPSPSILWPCVSCDRDENQTENCTCPLEPRICVRLPTASNANVAWVAFGYPRFVTRSRAYVTVRRPESSSINPLRLLPEQPERACVWFRKIPHTIAPGLMCISGSHFRTAPSLGVCRRIRESTALRWPQPVVDDSGARAEIRFLADHDVRRIRSADLALSDSVAGVSQLSTSEEVGVAESRRFCQNSGTDGRSAGREPAADRPGGLT